MNKTLAENIAPAPNGSIEPHKPLLMQPDEDAFLYKIIKLEHFFDMLEKKYLYFKRVDTYTDDKRDSDQPDGDRLLSEEVGFERNPNYTLNDYYEGSRKRTYACCFALENTPYHWETYGGDDPNPVCMVVHFGKLRDFLNRTLAESRIITQGQVWHNFFNINYGQVQYGDLEKDILTQKTHKNPIEYAYFKDNRWENDTELRITLSTIGIGNFANPDGSPFDFPETIQLAFDVQQATELGVIQRLEISNQNFMEEFSKKLRQARINVTD